mmetsp:Transcript_85441/g.104816  ORF Transcript_85441/g.104816 Transcript_85441/m.104816 type:complete len:380 (+) Transcript_85441:157-1296(+)
MLNNAVTRDECHQNKDNVSELLLKQYIILCKNPHNIEHSCSQSSIHSERILDKYSFGDLLYSDSSRNVYLGHDIQNCKHVIIYQQPCTPTILCYAQTKYVLHRDVLIMKAYGPSLFDLFKFKNYKFSLETISVIALKMLRILQYFGNKGVRHGSLGPKCIHVGIEHDTIDELMITDFTNWSTPDIKDAILKTLSLKKAINNIKKNDDYGNTHCIDDVKALGFILLYFLTNSKETNFEKYLLQNRKNKIYTKVMDIDFKILIMKWFSLILYTNNQSIYLNLLNALKSLILNNKNNIIKTLLKREVKRAKKNYETKNITQSDILDYIFRISNKHLLLFTLHDVTDYKYVYLLKFTKYYKNMRINIFILLKRNEYIITGYMT